MTTLEPVADEAALETPREFVDRRVLFAGRAMSVREIEALLVETLTVDREAIAAWCEQKAAEAQREAEAHDAQAQTRGLTVQQIQAKYERRECCEGQASAFRAMAAMLRGAR